MKRKPVNSPTDFILERYDELIERVVKAEVARKQMREELDYIRAAFMSAMQRPISLSLTDEQIDKIVSGLGKYITDTVTARGNIN